MQLVGVDAYNRAIFFVQVADMEDILAVQGVYLVVELVPEFRERLRYLK